MDIANTNVEVPKKKKNIRSLLTIEALIITVVGVIVVLILIIFNVIKLDRLVSRFLPVEGSKVNISASSQIPGYKISLENEDRLIKLLTEWGMLGKPIDGFFYSEGSTVGRPISDIEIHLVSDEQRVLKYATPDGVILSSAFIVLNPGRADVYVQMHPELFSIHNNLEFSSKFFDGVMLSVLYKNTHLIRGGEESGQVEYETRENEMRKEFKKYSNIKFVNISKD